MTNKTITSKMLLGTKIDDLGISELVKNRFNNLSVAEYSTKSSKDILSLAKNEGNNKLLLVASKIQNKENSDLWLISLAHYLYNEGKRSLNERNYKEAIKYLEDATHICFLKLENIHYLKSVKGKVTGVVDFGIFMDIMGTEGLVHKSEISWETVYDPNKYAKIGDEINYLAAS